MLGELTEERISELEAWLMGLTGEPPRGVSGDRRTVARLLCERLFLPAPPIERDDVQRDRAFDRLINGRMHGSGSLDVAYALPYPKWEFLRHLAARLTAPRFPQGS